MVVSIKCAPLFHYDGAITIIYQLCYRFVLIYLGLSQTLILTSSAFYSDRISDKKKQQ